MQKSQLSKQGRRFLGMIEFDQEEQLVAEVRRHPFGLFVIYATGAVIAGVLLAAVVGGAYLVGDTGDLGVDGGLIRTIMVVVGLVLTLISLAVTMISAMLYNSNVVLVTSEKIAQFLYTTIFDRKISQLSIGDVQDVTVSQKGVFARIFNYGTLVIETAGEQQNYTFIYTPDPYQVSKLIVGAHEENLKKYGN